ncbi:hypothetical protein GCM10022280_22240 [Sphingomonas swuensis]|uniref:Uncharacterized protein n=1 Tax=Sphingomonas swuensis TaxID=977800 RepID=A0ABP7T5H0_9SPHN
MLSGTKNVTILAALAVKNTVHFGYNDGHTVGDTPMPGEGYPWVWLGPWLLGVSGSSAAFAILCQHRERFADGCESIEALVLRIRLVLSESGIGQKDDDEVEFRFGVWCLLLHPRGEVWDLDDALAYSRIPEDTLWARGSGSDYALGAEHALKSFQVLAPERVRAAVEAAIALDLYCCGSGHVDVLKEHV